MMFTGNKSSSQFLIHMNVIMTNWKILIFVFLLYCCKTLQLEYKMSRDDLTYHLVPRAIWPYYVKWNFSTFCGFSRSTTYPCLPQGRIGPLDPRSYPQGGVQIYPMANLLHKMWKQKYPPPNSDFWKNLTLAWFWPIIWHISNPEPSDTF